MLHCLIIYFDVLASVAPYKEAPVCRVEVQKQEKGIQNKHENTSFMFLQI